MNCPNCGADAGFRPMAGAGQCGVTGNYDDDFLVCLACDAPTDAKELDRIARKDAQSEHGDTKEKRTA